MKAIDMEDGERVGASSMPQGCGVISERVAETEEISAIAESAEDFFAERKGRGDKDAAIRFLTRSSGESPRVGDELPDY